MNRHEGQSLMRIGQLAKRTGASVKTLRFYDSLGIILTAGRSAANYRLFHEDAVSCVNCIRICKDAGMTMGDLRELAEICRSGTSLRKAFPRKLEQVLKRLNRKEAEIKATRARLLDLRARVSSGENSPLTLPVGGSCSFRIRPARKVPH